MRLRQFYLWDPGSPRLIRNAVPEAKIIITLRDPVERAFSDYLMMSVHYNFEPLSFMEALRANARQPESRWGERLYLELGEYSEQVRRYLDVFGESKVKIILFEDLKEDTRGTVNEVLEFLDVPETPSPGNFGGPQSFLRSENATGPADHKQRSNTEVGPATRSRAREGFSPPQALVKTCAKTSNVARSP